jgi:hypothetical protein
MFKCPLVAQALFKPIQRRPCHEGFVADAKACDFNKVIFFAAFRCTQNFHVLMITNSFLVYGSLIRGQFRIQIMDDDFGFFLRHGGMIAKDIDITSMGHYDTKGS